MTTRHPGAGEDSRPHQRPRTWRELLNHLRAELADTERLLAPDFRDELRRARATRATEPSWTPPAGLGPLPEDLREEAAQLLQHQLDAAERLAVAITASKRQQQVTSRLDGGPTRPPPAFFDSAL